MSRGGIISRRGFLGAGGAAIAISAVAGIVWLQASAPDYVKLAGGLTPTTLGVSEFGVLSALAAAMIAPMPGGPSVKDAMTAARIDRELSFHPDSTLAEDIAASLTLLEHWPIVQGYGARFTALAAEQQATFLSACANGGPGLTRSAFAGVRFLVVFFYYSDDRTWPGLGYAGPSMPEKLFEGGNRIANLSQVKRADASAVRERRA